jgi:hypothetical protein
VYCPGRDLISWGFSGGHGNPPGSVPLLPVTFYCLQVGLETYLGRSSHRHLGGEGLREDPDGRQKWTMRPVEHSTYDRVVELAGLGMSQNDIASDLGLNKSTVCRHLKKAKTDGRIIDFASWRGNRRNRKDIDDPDD